MAKLTFNKLKRTEAIWLPQIPEHWDLIKVRHLFKESTKKGFPNETLLVASQEHGVVSKGTYGKRTVEATKDLQNLKLVEQGNFVISLRSFQGGIELAHERGIISPAYTIMEETSQIDKRYFKNLFKSPPFISLMTLCVKGIREGQNIDYPTFKNEYLPFPPLEEQQEISAYLDKKNNKIDKFIRNKERLIELLEEQKITIIHQSISESKSEKKRLKFACFLSRGYDLSSDKFKDGNTPIYGSNGIIGYHNFATTKAPCITVGRSGSVGEVNFVDCDFWAHNTSLYVYRNYKNDWKFLYFLLLTLDMKSYAAGTAVGSLNRNNVHEILVSIPKINEQINIANKIQSELNKKMI
jgi:restriction endonuclease S subunit